jgi:methionyl-tRNA formyltransferase
MRLDDVGMIVADTTRSKAYLHALRRNKVIPSSVLFLRNPDRTALPGQSGSFRRRMPDSPDQSQECWSEAGFDTDQTVHEMLAEMGIEADVVNCTDINHPDVIERVRAIPESVLIYSGYGGALLRAEILGTGKRFLHVHGGYLPDYKGSTTNYYSLLAEGNMGASSLFLSAEIDGGPILLRRKFPPPHDLLAIDHVYDSAARARVLVDTLKAYVSHGGWTFELAGNVGGETYYIIHPVLKHIAIMADMRDCQ